MWTSLGSHYYMPYRAYKQIRCLLVLHKKKSKGVSPELIRQLDYTIRQSGSFHLSVVSSLLYEPLIVCLLPLGCQMAAEPPGISSMLQEGRRWQCEGQRSKRQKGICLRSHSLEADPSLFICSWFIKEVGLGEISKWME